MSSNAFRPCAGKVANRKKELNQGDNSKDLVFDGWPEKEGWEFQQFLDVMGPPDYLLVLNATRATCEDRYKIKEGIDEINPEDEEEKAKIDAMTGDWS